MIILSKLFLLIFLPVSLLIYWKLLTTHRKKLWGLFVFSVFFYSFAGISNLLLLLGLSLVTFYFSKKNWFGPGIALNIITLALFKYWDFGVFFFRHLFANSSWAVYVPFLNLLLPLGISFYIFKHISYLLDVKNERYPATNDLLAFLTYSAFFPQISAGPITTFKDTGTQLIKPPKKFDRAFLREGIVFITLGMIKKVIVAEGMLQILNSGIYQAGQSGILGFWFSTICQGIYLLMDFSGYTDIALGIGLLFGITLPDNFDSPFLARSPSDFWKRWHISLSIWFRVYVFSPISRTLLKNNGRLFKENAQYIANWVTMLLVGIWHGASIQYLLWGLLHGSLLNLFVWLRKRKVKWVDTWVGSGLTLLAVFFSWHLFFTPWRSLSLSMPDMLGFNGPGSLANIIANIPQATLPMLIVGVVLSFSRFAEARHYAKLRAPLFLVMIGLVFVLLIGLFGEPMNFNYVQF